jgi:hypothetical protein
MVLIAFAPIALLRRVSAVELDHTLLIEANRLDERVLGGFVPQVPLVRSRRGRVKKCGLRWREWTVVKRVQDCVDGCVTLVKWLLTLGVGELRK